VEAPVPAQARLGLAGVVFLEFRSTAHEFEHHRGNEKLKG
jgi:hypothetical protein